MARPAICAIECQTMITFLSGTLVESLPNRIIVDVGGVGYEVLIPISSYDRLPPPGQQVKILTHFHVREDAQVLFGFATDEERDLFRLLIQRVSGVGPKLAMAVLSGMSVGNFKSSVVNGDIQAISKISGLGKKTAERIVLELKDKVGIAAAWEAASDSHAPTPEQAAANDAVLALIALGFKQVDAHRAVKKVTQGGEFGGADVTSEVLVREALKKLN